MSPPHHGALRGHVRALDGLRGLAIVGVLLYHGGHLDGGFLGVDLFFVLSGFLITSLLVGEHGERGRVDLVAFWVRRARRLLPALLALLAVVAVAAPVWVSDGELGRLRGDGLAALLYVANWRAVASDAGYWDLFREPSPLAHLWSLAVEEQVYLLWPLLVVGCLAVTRRSRRVLLAATVALAAASAVWAVALHRPGVDPSRIYYGTDTRAAAVLIGAALAVAISEWGHLAGRRRRMALEAGALVAGAGLAWAWVSVDGQDAGLYRGGLLACGVAAAVLLASASHPEPGPVSRVLAFAPLCWLGLVSYGLYLWHWPVYLGLDEARTGLTGAGLLAVRLVVSVAVAAASYVWLERPVRNGALAGRRGVVALPAALGVAAVALVAVPLHRDPRTEVDVAGALAVLEASPTPRPLAATTIPPVSEVRSSTAEPASTLPVSAPPPTTPPPLAGPPARVLVVGDSVGAFLYGGVERLQATHGFVSRNETKVGCGVVRGSGRSRLPDGRIRVDDPACREWPQRWAAAIEEQRPDLVLLVQGWWTLDREVDGTWVAPCTRAFDDWYRGEMRAALDVLTHHGAAVVLTTTPYYRETAIPVPDDVDRRVDCLNAIYREVVAERPHQARVVDLAGWLCPGPGALCHEEVEGVVLRPDGLHFEGAGAQVAAAWIVEQAVTAAREPGRAPDAATGRRGPGPARPG